MGMLVGLSPLNSPLLFTVPHPSPLTSDLSPRLQDKAADTIESLHKAGMKVWVLTGDKMETAAATCYASKLFRRSTQILELTTKRTEEQSLHDVLHDLSRTVLRHHGSMTRDTLSGWAHTHTHTKTHTPRGCAV